MAVEKELIKHKCPVSDPLFSEVRTWSPELQDEFQEYYSSQITQNNGQQSTELFVKHMEQEQKNMKASVRLQCSRMSLQRETTEFLAFRAKQDAYIIRQNEAKMKDLHLKGRLEASSAEAKLMRERLGLQYQSKKAQDEFRLERDLKDRERKLIQAKIKQCFYDSCNCMDTDASSTQSDECACDMEKSQECFRTGGQDERMVMPDNYER